MNKLEIPEDGDKYSTYFRAINDGNFEALHSASLELDEDIRELALTEYNHLQDIENIKRFKNDSSWRLRSRTVRLLSKYKCISCIIDMTSDIYYKVRRQAAIELGRHNEITALHRMLADKNEFVVMQVLYELKLLKDYDALIHASRHHPKADIRIECAKYLTEDSMYDEVRNMMNDKNYRVRKNVVKCLGKLGLITELYFMQKDPDHIVRDEARKQIRCLRFRN